MKTTRAYLGFEPIRLTLPVLQPPFHKDSKHNKMLDVYGTSN